MGPRPGGFRLSLLAGLILVVPLAGGPGSEATSSTVLFANPSPEVPPILWNDNEERAGNVEEGALRLHLEVRRGAWHILGEGNGSANVLAFAEVGKEARIPGPMIRVPEGTEVIVRVSNPLDAPLEIQGLSARQVPELATVTVEPGRTREIRFLADVAGTYMYRGHLKDSPTRDEPFEDEVLAGAFIVDDPAAPAVENEKVMVIQEWFGDEVAPGEPDFGQAFPIINGRPWPHTERLLYGMGDRIHWRVINASDAIHPMHLHGFFFDVEARGDLARDTAYWPNQTRRAVTERMAPWTTMRVSWSPDRPGGWIFHCHITFHVLPNARLGEDQRNEMEVFTDLARGKGGAGDPHDHAEHAMGGLVMGIYVQPPEDWVADEPRGEPMRLYVQSDSVSGNFTPRFGFVLQEDEAAPAPDSTRFPGPPLILPQGPLGEIRVFNRTDEPTQLHWHGLELESYYDGVAGMTGYPDRRTPAIFPGDSFDVALRTTRPGTYIYHTHMSDIRHQGSGLYGALIVLPAEEDWDPDANRIFILGNGLGEEAQPLGVYLNGSDEPEPVEMVAGSTYRLRLINITLGNAAVRFRLTRDGMLEAWSPVANDAWGLPEHRQEGIPAEKAISVGETYDYAYTPEVTGEVHLEVRSGEGRLLIDQMIQVMPPRVPREDQIAAALLAAPADRRDGAKVYGYDEKGNLVTLREGTNDMVCLADRPGDGGWSVACYHESVDPYMARGRELRAQGVSGGEVNERRWTEVAEGTLDLPDGAVLYVLHGDGWDAEAGKVENPYLRWVIYRPFATPEDTGLPTLPRTPGEPWLMFPGTAGAHVMITPPRGG